MVATLRLRALQKGLLEQAAMFNFFSSRILRQFDEGGPKNARLQAGKKDTARCALLSGRSIPFRSLVRPFSVEKVAQIAFRDDRCAGGSSFVPVRCYSTG